MEFVHFDQFPLDFQTFLMDCEISLTFLINLTVYDHYQNCSNLSKIYWNWSNLIEVQFWRLISNHRDFAFQKLLESKFKLTTYRCWDPNRLSSIPMRLIKITMLTARFTLHVLWYGFLGFSGFGFIFYFLFF